MSWLAIHIDANAAHVESLSDILLALGALSVSITDTQAGTAAEQPIFGEPGEPSDTVWQQNTLTALFADTTDPAQVMHTASTQLDIPLPDYQLEQIAETDWVRATQAQFGPIAISERLCITPSWHAAPTDHAVQLRLDPGLAFGTGSHPTTRLCLQWLDRHTLNGQSVLDYGCGSGILAIAAMKLGAKSADGVDIDPQAIVAGEQNAQQNQVNIAFYLPDDAPQQQYDIVIANILANPLKVLAPMLANRCTATGDIVLSGILSAQAQEILTIYQQWFEMTVSPDVEGWALLHGRRRDD